MDAAGQGAVSSVPSSGKVTPSKRVARGSTRVRRWVAQADWCSGRRAVLPPAICDHVAHGAKRWHLR
jgi:hypothetical protein